MTGYRSHVSMGMSYHEKYTFNSNQVTLCRKKADKAPGIINCKMSNNYLKCSTHAIMVSRVFLMVRNEETFAWSEQWRLTIRHKRRRMNRQTDR